MHQDLENTTKNERSKIKKNIGEKSMGLDITLFMDVHTGIKEYRYDLFDCNITHNVGKMAAEAGIYKALWRGEEINAKYAEDIIPILEDGLIKLKKNPKHFKLFNSSNGYGTYEGLLEFIESLLNACKKHPRALIETWG